MFVPLSDDNPLRAIRFQYVTLLLILINCIVFAIEAAGLQHRVVASFAVIPAELIGVGVTGGAAMGPLDAWPIDERYTLISYMFFHGDLLHLGGNMLFLWVFGDNVEDAMGHVRYAIFYLLCGVIAGLTHAALLPNSGVPLVGASGAVAGVIAAYLMLHPRVMVWVLAFKVIPLRISAMFVLGAWIATQFLMVMIPQVGPTAWWAHIGGLVAGAMLVLFMRRPGVVLFDRHLSSA